MEDKIKVFLTNDITTRKLVHPVIFRRIVDDLGLSGTESNLLSKMFSVLRKTREVVMPKRWAEVLSIVSQLDPIVELQSSIDEDVVLSLEFVSVPPVIRKPVILYLRYMTKKRYQKSLRERFSYYWNKAVNKPNSEFVKIDIRLLAINLLLSGDIEPNPGPIIHCEGCGTKYELRRIEYPMFICEQCTLYDESFMFLYRASLADIRREYAKIRKLRGEQITCTFCQGILPDIITTYDPVITQEVRRLIRTKLTCRDCSVDARGWMVPKIFNGYINDTLKEFRRRYKRIFPQRRSFDFNTYPAYVYWKEQGIDMRPISWFFDQFYRFVRGTSRKDDSIEIHMPKMTLVFENGQLLSSPLFKETDPLIVIQDLSTILALYQQDCDQIYFQVRDLVNRQMLVSGTPYDKYFGSVSGYMRDESYFLEVLRVLELNSPGDGIKEKCFRVNSKEYDFKLFKLLYKCSAEELEDLYLMMKQSDVPTKLEYLIRD